MMSLTLQKKVYNHFQNRHSVTLSGCSPHCTMVSAQVAQGFAAMCDLVLKNGPGHLGSNSRPKPVVYSSSYNISFFYLEKLHPFDPCKYAKVLNSLRKQELIDQVRLSSEESHCLPPVNALLYLM
jgi:hypothetical protein